MDKERRSAELLYKYNERAIRLSMQTYRECIPHLINKLEALDMLVKLDDDTSTAPGRKPMEALPASAMAKATAQRVAKRKAQAADLDSDDDPKDLLPTKYLSLG